MRISNSSQQTIIAHSGNTRKLQKAHDKMLDAMKEKRSLKNMVDVINVIEQEDWSR